MATAREIAEQMKKKNQSEGGKTTSIDARQAAEYVKKYSGVNTDHVNNEFINSFFSEAGNFLGNAKTEENSYNTWQDLSSRANTLKAWTWKNSDALDEESYKSLNESLSAFDSAGEYWNQFKSPEEYSEFWKEYSSYYDKWGKYAEAEDFAQGSQYVSTRTDVDEKEAYNAWTNMYDTSKLFGDIQYDYINRNEDARGVAGLNDISTGASLVGVDNSFLKEMTDDEIAIYNYLYATQSPDVANEFIKDIHDDLTRRQRTASEEYWRNFAKESPVGSSVFSVLTSPLKGISYFGQTVDYLDDGKIDQNAGYNKFSYSNSAIRNEVSSGMGDVGSFLYNTGMSIGDFLYTSAITGGNSTAAKIIMGTSAAADTIMASKDMGLSDNQAMFFGVAAGAFEAATERYSLEALFDTKHILEGSFGKYIIKNIITEASEEGANNVLNSLAELLDLAITGDESKIKREIYAIMQEQGISESEAAGKYISGKFKELGLDMLGGALSGGVVGGGSVGVNLGINAIGNLTNKITGKPISNIPTVNMQADTLEQAAMDVVNDRKGKETKPFSFTEAQKVTGFGNYGSELVTSIANSEGITLDQAKKNVETAYLAGFTGMDKAQASFVTEMQEKAFDAGKRDGIMQNTAAKEKAKTATVYGKDSGVIKNEYYEKLSPAEQEMFSVFAEDFGESAEMVNEIVAAVIDGKKYMASAEHSDGRIRGSASTKKPVHQWILHENGHRMEQFATDEWNALSGALYARAEQLGRRIKLDESKGMQFDSVKNQYDNAGQGLSTRGYVGEVVMRELEIIFSSAEEFNAWRAELDAKPQVKTAWEKFMDWLTEILEKIKSIVANRKLSPEARAAAKAEIAEIERIKELYASAYKATRTAVAERTSAMENAKAEQTEAQTEPDTLEKAAKDVVDQRNAARASENKPQATNEGKGEQTPTPKAITHTAKNKPTPESEFDNVLKLGTGSVDGKQRVAEFYSTNPSKADAIEFLKKEYGQGGQSITLSDGTRGYTSHDAKGLKIDNYKGDVRVFSWSEVDDHLRKLIKNGEYGVKATVKETASKKSATKAQTSTAQTPKAETTERKPSNTEVAGGEIKTLKHSKSVYPLFKGANMVRTGEGIVASSSVAIPLTDEALTEIKKVVEERNIGIGDSFSFKKLGINNNDVIISGNPKIAENLYVFKVGSEYYICEQKYLDAFNNGENTIKANKDKRIPWAVYDKNGNIAGAFVSTKVPMTDAKYDSLQSVNDVLEATKAKKAAQKNAPFNATETNLLCSMPRLLTFEMNGDSYITDGSVVIKTDNSALEYIKGEYKAKSNNEVSSIDGAKIEAVAKNEVVGEVSKTVADNITETDKNGKARVKHRRTACIVGDMAFLYNTKYVDMLSKRSAILKILSGGNLVSTVLAGYDSDGGLTGFIMPIRPEDGGSVEVDGKKIPYTINIKKESSAPKKAAAKETANKSKPKVVETTAKIDDFGEKIGGARKDQWNTRGLLVDDLDGMNDREREKNVKKDNVWKRPNYRALVEAGGDRGLLWAVNEIRKSLQQNIFYGYSHNLTAEIKAEKQKLFIETVRAIQEMAENAKTRADFEAMGEKWLLDNGYLEKTPNVYKPYAYTNKFSNNPALYGTNYLNNIRYLAKNFDNLTNLADRNQFAVDAKSVMPKGFSIVGGEGSVGGKLVDGEWVKDTSYGVAKGRYIIKDGFATKEEALEWIKQGLAKKKGKTRFVPEQLLEVHRKGPDYRNSKNVDGQNYIDTFGFKGGEFGNWMSAKDRQVSLDYGFDALKDLADALGIADTDISFNGNLNIAFGARGQGLSGASAHYENERRVINLTKMNGAGSLAHEWFHALDDFIGGYTNNFATDRYHTLPERTKQAIRDLITTMQYKDATQEETDLSKQKQYEQAVRGITNTIEGEFRWVKPVESGTFKEADAKYYKRVPTLEDAKKYRELFDKLIETGEAKYVDELSNLRKEVNGRVIPKETRDTFVWRLASLNSAKSASIQRARKMTDFYDGSRTFGKLHAKDGDYWDSTVEMSARAFACYVADKTNKQNDYLSAHSDSAITLNADKDGNPVIVRAFPVGEERAAINNAFDNLIEALKADGFLHESAQREKPAEVSYSLEDSERDRTYIDAVESGDMETAQKMVDEAAKAAGYTEEVFHGMGNRYNTYKSGNGQYGAGVYFTADKGIASDYGKVVDHLFVKIGNIADYEDAYKALGKTDSQTLDEFAQSLGFPNFDDMISDWDNDPTEVASNPDLIDMLKNRGFEGFVDDGNAGFVLWDFDGIAYRIKSAEPVTYDDNGNVIPLSERFNSENKDIRYSLEETDSDGNMLTEEQADFFKDSKAKDSQGRLLVMYHGTSNGGFTQFDTYGYYAKFGLFGNGTYFTENKDIAETYTKKGRGSTPQVYSVYLNITNPLDMDARADVEAWNRALQKTGEDFSLLKGKMTNEEAFKRMTEDLEYMEVYDYDGADTVRAVIEEMGYDGITHIGGGRVNASDGTKHRVFIAFEPEQIKSTDNKTPTSDPDIRYSLEDEGKFSNNFSNNLEIKTKKGYNGNTKSSRNTDWHTDLTKMQMEQVLKWLDNAGTPAAKRITDTAYWYKGRIDGEDLFVIYSVEDSTGKTILYEVKGGKAKLELDILIDLLEGEENGESINGEPSFTQRVSERSWLQYANGVRDHIQRLGGSSNNQDVRILRGQSRRNSSGAFRNVIDNLFAKRGDVIPQPDTQYSLDDLDEAPSKKTKEFLNAIEDLRNGKKNASDKLVKYVDSGMISTDDYDSLIEKYGAIHEGEKPYREIQVPQKTAKDKKVSQTVRTILEAKATPDEAIPTIEKMVEDGVFSYDVYTDKQAIKDAEDYIKEYGWDESLRDWLDSVNKGEVSKQITALGWTLYNNAANTAKTATTQNERDVAVRTSLEILTAMVQHQRSAAQAVQATRILKKLSPEAQLYSIQKTASALLKELKAKYGKKAPNLKIDEKLAEDFLNAKTQEERDTVAEEIYKDIGRQMPSDWLDKWNAWRYLAMLGNPRTHIKNIGGNAFFAPVVLTKNLTATAIESIVYRVSGKKTLRGKALVTGNKADRALLKAAWGDYATVADRITNGGKYNDSALINQSIEEGRRIFKFKPLEKARKLNSAALEAEDMWFSQPHYAYALAQYCKANNITPEQIERGKAIAPAREYAIKEAQKATYRDTNAFSHFVSKLGRSNMANKNNVEKAVSTVIEGVLPFRKTPANILVRGIEYSPIGLLKGLTYDLYKVSKSRMTSTEAIDNISAGLTGTGLLALGALLAAQGLVRGSGSGDKEEKEFMETMGHQAYSLELPNGQSITLDWLAPEALPFFVGVNLWEATKGSDEKVNLSSILSAITNVSDPMLEMSFLQGLNDVFESVGYASSNDTSALMAILSSAVTSYFTQAFPTIMGQIERTTEGHRMSTYTEKDAFLTGDMQYILGKISAKIPFWDYQQIPYIDAWGRKEASGTALKRFLNNFLNPAYTSTIEMSDMEEELLRLFEQTGENSVFPERADKYFTVDGERKDLTADEYVRYATLKGEKSYEAITKLVQSKEYKSLSDSEKVKAIEEAYTYADQKAKSAVSNYKPDKWVTTADDLGTNVEDFFTFRVNVSAAGADGSKTKAEVVDIILGMDIDNDDAWTLYLSNSNYASESALAAKKYGINAKLYMSASVEMANIKPDYYRNGKEIEGSRETKIKRYLSSVCGSYREYLFLLASVYSRYQNNSDYIAYFGK